MIEYLNIIQFNCGKSNGNKSRALFDGLEANRYPILAIQEPGQHGSTLGKTYVPPNYRLGRELGVGSRVAFMVHNKIAATEWEVLDATDYVERLRLQTSEGPLNVINVYNPPGDVNQPRPEKWGEIQRAVAGAGREEILLLGDFNCHHPEWAGPEIAREPKADFLIHQLAQKGMQNLNEEGVATWGRGEAKAVLDLGFATGGVGRQVIEYAPKPEWALLKDHYPISIRIERGVKRKGTSQRYSLKNVEWGGFVAEAAKIQWGGAPAQAIVALQEGLGRCLDQYAKRAKPSDRARHDWSPQAAEFLAGARRARARMAQGGDPDAHREWKQQRNRLRSEMRSNRRTSWRKNIEEATRNEENPDKPRNRGLWQLARWSRDTQKTGLAALPALRATTDSELKNDNHSKTEILAESFFPSGEQADLSDIDPQEDWPRLEIDPTVTKEELLKAIRGLPSRKAPGPDAIANEVLKKVAGVIAEKLAEVFTAIHKSGITPEVLKESLTVTLRKEKKQDYSLPGSYRPIALENTMAKLLEGCAARRLTQAAEEHGLLPWNQMGARRKRSTLSALELLTGTIETAWRAKKTVVSVLGLDLRGAFNKVSTERLCWVLRRKGIPEWLVKIVLSFLTNRKTKIVLADWVSDWIHTTSGIPQGSTLSPILFLFFISELLEHFQEVRGNLIGFGFVDDGTLVTWSNSAAQNCRILEGAHEFCEAWARRYGAVFAPEKYQLIHFTKQRALTEDLKSTIRIQGKEAELLQSMKVLGVWLDSRLSWKDHIRRATDKGLKAFNSLARVTSAVWGPEMRKSRLLYTAVARPIMTYGAPIWATGNNGQGLPSEATKSMAVVQNKCLRKITGAYKRTETAAIEREVAVPPIDLYIRSLAVQRAAKTGAQPVSQEIARALDQVWASARVRKGGGRGRRPTQLPTRRERTRVEETRRWAGEIQRQTKQEGLGVRKTMQFRSQYPRIDEHFTALWRKRWMAAAEKHGNLRRGATWRGKWEEQPLFLYEGLRKHEATALFLMRTEVLGLKGWLAGIGVPGVSPQCGCGATKQTLAHVWGYCPELRNERARVLARIGHTRMDRALQDREQARWAARWLLETGLLDQFRVALEVEVEGMEDWAPFAVLQ